MKRTDIDKLIIRNNNVLVHLKLKKLSSGIILTNGEEVDQDRYEVFVLKTGDAVKDIKPGDQVFLAAVALDQLPIDDLPKDEMIAYTPESFIKMYIPLASRNSDSINEHEVTN